MSTASVFPPPAPPPSPGDLSPEDRDALEWLQNVYQGDRVRQLSVRSIVTGMLIGGVMSVSNLYVGLKTGWGLGVTITACIIAFAVFKTGEKIYRPWRREPFTILENNTMSSAASAAGYMSSAGLVSSFPALLMTTGQNLGFWDMAVFLSALSVLGVFMAVPLKRQLINVDKLPFPTGTATAETLRSMHTAGKEAIDKARALFWGALGGAVLAFGRDAPVMGKLAVPGSFPLVPGATGKRWEEQLTFGFEGSLIMVAAGAIMGIRVGASLLLGAIVYYGIIGPQLIAGGVITGGGYRNIVAWILWPATAMMVTSGLLSFALKWRTIVRALSGLAAVFGGKDTGRKDPLAHVEVPGSWFVIGVAAAGLVTVAWGHFRFGITWWMGVVAVLATFLLAVVAARATGETDVTPVGAMGKITQLMYGVIAPSNITTNLLTATVTAGASSHGADLLTDMKSGYLLGAKPRYQTIAQLFGVAAGSVFAIPVYMLIVTPEKLGTAELPAPAAKVWAAVAEMLAKGLDALPAGAVDAMVVGGLVGVAITLAETYLPRYRRWIPSATGLGIAGVIPAFNSISMFVGALAAWVLMRSRPATGEKYTVAVSSGIIAGESLMGVAIILWLKGPEIVQLILDYFRG